MVPSDNMVNGPNVTGRMGELSSLISTPCVNTARRARPFGRTCSGEAGTWGESPRSRLRDRFEDFGDGDGKEFREPRWRPA
jgi:hypothetical protein